ncbi:MAG: hypothetical protein KDB96_13440 [Flavobacteriales bacterium]|nr:hypothetical protein [Flavobacteriales bacterium]
MFTHTFQATARGADGDMEISYDQGLHYRGILNGQEGWAAISISSDGVMGVIPTQAGNMVLGATKWSFGGTEYMIYNDQDLVIEMPFACLSDGGEATSQEAGSMDQPGRAKGGGCFLELLWIGDYDLYIQSGFNVNTSLNYLAGIFNNVGALYQQEGVPLYLNELLVFIIPDGYSETDSGLALDQFGADISYDPLFDEDLVMLLALITNSNYSGVAVIDALCANYDPGGTFSWGRFAYSRIENYYEGVPLYSWTVSVATHEMGHNIGSRHTHWCGWPGGALDNCQAVEPDNFGNYCPPGPYPFNGGTIMSYCHNLLGSINFLNGFGYYPNQEILSDLNSAPCLCFVGVEEYDVWLAEIMLAPVPARTEVVITLPADLSGDVSFEVVSALGAVVHRSSSVPRVLDVSQWSPGTYAAVFRMPGARRSVRFQVIR